MILDLVRVECLSLIRVNDRGDHVRSLVHVGEEKSGADGGLSVESRAAVAMPASADLEVERTVHTILFGSENRSQMLRHNQIQKRTKAVRSHVHV